MLWKYIKLAIPFQHARLNNQKHTGVGKDMPGPETYKPDVSFIKRKTAYAQFSKSKEARKGNLN